MKIALIGYGKMGHEIERIALERGHEIVCTIDMGEEAKYDSEAFRSADVAIEFTVPASAVANYGRCFDAGMPVVSGTTGWLADFSTVSQLCTEMKGRMLYGSNFSIGVNIFWAVNSYMASIMKNFTDYLPTLSETHHIHKLDHPSGTAITTAEKIMAADPWIKKWGEDEAAGADVLSIHCNREGEVPGIHTVRWESGEDVIELTHSAKSRAGFALGAVVGAEWLVKQQPGLYNITDMLADITGTTDIFK